MDCLLKLCIIVLLLALLYLYIYVKKEKFDNFPKIPKPTIDASIFQNKDLLEISKYAIGKYVSVPNDPALTNFYKLGVDENYNIMPKI